MAKRITKTALVLSHLQRKGSITSTEAFNEYGATRLSAIIFNLRDKYEIKTEIEPCVDRYGANCQFARYYYAGEK